MKRERSSMPHHEIDYCCDEGVTCPVSPEEIVRDVSLVLDQEDVERPCLMSVSVVSDERMAALNERWRGCPQATDVISLECERPCDPDLAPGEPCELGDVVIAPDYVARQARRYGTAWADEFRLLLVHGTLHLLGYDHLEEDEARAMEAREDELVRLVVADERVAPVRLTRHREG